MSRLFYLCLFLLHSFTLISLVAVHRLHAQLPNLEIEGKLIDKHSGAPVFGAHVLLEARGQGTTTNQNGEFKLNVPSSSGIIFIHALGYEEVRASFDASSLDLGILELTPKVLQLESILVQGTQARTNDGSQLNSTVNGVEDLVRNIAGVQLIQRGQFALEPMIRSFQASQIGMTIDGMKVYGACVDRMDPASSYIEMENLSSIQVDKSGSDLSVASQVGGSLNFITRKATLNSGLQMEQDMGVESAALARKSRTAIAYSNERWGVRASLSYREADDFTAGDGVVVPISSYQKRNYKLDIRFKLNHHHQISASFLGDDAWDVGFPALLMDATLAQSRVYSIQHHWDNHQRNRFKATQKLYLSTVDHWMDDRYRDVQARRVMNGMFMPMYGNTQTIGLYNTYDWFFDRVEWTLTTDAHTLNAFGDMWMYSLFPNIPDMYLLNLGDAELWNAALTLSSKIRLHSNQELILSSRLDASTRDVGRQEMKTMLKGYWGISETQQEYLIPSFSAKWIYRWNANRQVQLSLSQNQRLPSHVENYGHYVYNYIDGFFYTGRPDLKPERATTVDVRWNDRLGNVALQINAFWTTLRDMIVGLEASEGNVEQLSGGSYQFRLYGNAPRARLLGFEGALQFMPNSDWLLSTNLSALHGQNISFNEPMPMIAPIHGGIVLRWQPSSTYVEVSSDWALAQNRIANRAAIEDRTDGYNLIGIMSGVTIRDKWELSLGVRNIFDQYVVNHLSFGNVPMLGRNFEVAVKWRY